MTEFDHTPLLPLTGDETDFRKLDVGGVEAIDLGGHEFLRVEPEAITALTSQAMFDIAHYLRPGHLQQLRNILEDPEASGNDRFVALDLLKNANVAAGGVLPMCQDTGTAIVKAKKGERVLTALGDEHDGDEAAIARGIFDTYQSANLRYSQMAPLSMWEETNTKTNLPAEIKIAATGGAAYEFLFMAKGGGSANKTFLFQQTKAVLNEAKLEAFLEEKIKTLGTAGTCARRLGVTTWLICLPACIQLARPTTWPSSLEDCPPSST